MNLSPTAMFALPDSDLILPVPKEALLSVRRLGLKLRSFTPAARVDWVGGGDFDWVAGGEPGV